MLLIYGGISIDNINSFFSITINQVENVHRGFPAKLNLYEIVRTMLLKNYDPKRISSTYVVMIMLFLVSYRCIFT